MEVTLPTEVTDDFNCGEVTKNEEDRCKALKAPSKIPHG
jgi:hypothetical protein